MSNCDKILNSKTELIKKLEEIKNDINYYNYFLIDGNFYDINNYFDFETTVIKIFLNYNQIPIVVFNDKVIFNPSYSKEFLINQSSEFNVISIYNYALPCVHFENFENKQNIQNSIVHKQTIMHTIIKEKHVDLIEFDTNNNFVYYKKYFKNKNMKKNIKNNFIDFKNKVFLTKVSLSELDSKNQIPDDFYFFYLKAIDLICDFIGCLQSNITNFLKLNTCLDINNMIYRNILKKRDEILISAFFQNVKENEWTEYKNFKEYFKNSYNY